MFVLLNGYMALFSLNTLACARRIFGDGFTFLTNMMHSLKSSLGSVASAATTASLSPAAACAALAAEPMHMNVFEAFVNDKCTVNPFKTKRSILNKSPCNLPYNVKVCFF